MKHKVKEGKKSESVIQAYHDFLLTTSNENIQLPSDVNSTERDNTTVFDPNDDVPHPSSFNLLESIVNPDRMQEIYCSSCNAQSRHKHQSYCDKNHKKR